MSGVRVVHARHVVSTLSFGAVRSPFDPFGFCLLFVWRIGSPIPKGLNQDGSGTRKL